MEVLIRKAMAEDCEAMMDLIRELAAFEQEPNAVTVSLSDFRDAGFGEHPVWKAFIAVSEAGIEKRSKIVGLALYYIRYSTWKGRMLYLEDIIVQQAFRGKGIGSLLFNQLLAVSKEENFAGLAWQVLDWNESAISFYKKTRGIELDNSWINARLMQ